jgi:hypothetical protein
MVRVPSFDPPSHTRISTIEGRSWAASESRQSLMYLRSSSVGSTIETVGWAIITTVPTLPIAVGGTGPSS